MIVQALAGPPDPHGRRGRCYLLFDPESRQAAAIDPGTDRRGIRGFLEAHGGTLITVATTGATSGGLKCAQATATTFNVPWLALPGVVGRIPGQAGGAVERRPEAPIGRHALRLDVAPDGEAALVLGPGLVFTGLALLAGEIPAEPEPARFRARATWLRRVLGELPARTRLYPGVGPVSEVGLERTCNQELWG